MSTTTLLERSDLSERDEQLLARANREDARKIRSKLASKHGPVQKQGAEMLVELRDLHQRCREAREHRVFRHLDARTKHSISDPTASMASKQAALKEFDEACSQPAAPADLERLSSRFNPHR